MSRFLFRRPIPILSQDEAERFWKFVNKTPNGCWNWTGAKSAGGYGHFGVGGRRGGCLLAHRIAYVNIKGPVDNALVLDHLCENRSCVNPDHLEPVSHGENLKRGYWSSESRMVLNFFELASLSKARKMLSVAKHTFAIRKIMENYEQTFD